MQLTALQLGLHRDGWATERPTAHAPIGPSGQPTTLSEEVRAPHQAPDHDSTASRTHRPEGARSARRWRDDRPIDGAGGNARASGHASVVDVGDGCPWRRAVVAPINRVANRQEAVAAAFDVGLVVGSQLHACKQNQQTRGTARLVSESRSFICRVRTTPQQGVNPCTPVLSPRLQPHAKLCGVLRTLQMNPRLRPIYPLSHLGLKSGGNCVAAWRRHV